MGKEDYTELKKDPEIKELLMNTFGEHLTHEFSDLSKRINLLKKEKKDLISQLNEKSKPITPIKYHKKDSIPLNYSSISTFLIFRIRYGKPFGFLNRKKESSINKQRKPRNFRRPPPTSSNPGN